MRAIPALFAALTIAVFAWGFAVALNEANERAQEEVVPMPEWLRALPHKGAMQYRYQNQTVYYVPPGCCDLPGTLYDRQGNVLCHPDGGFTGLGDRRCPDFADKRTGGRPVH